MTRGRAPALYKDGRYDKEAWRKEYMAIGDRSHRLQWLGDRLLEVIEERNLNDQTGVPPDLLHLINAFRTLTDQPTVVVRNTFQAHDIVLKSMRVLMDPKVLNELLQNKDSAW